MTRAVLLLFAIVTFFVISDYSFFAKEIVDANWEYFEQQDKVDREEVKQFLRRFPVQTFWDTLKGEYKIGVVGERASDLSAPGNISLITWVEKQVLQNGKIVKVNQPIVDQNAVFMLMLLAIQDLSYISDHLMSLMDKYEQVYDFSKLSELINRNNLTSVQDVENSLTAAKVESRLIALKGELLRRRAAFSRLSEEEQSTKIEKVRSSLHNRLLQQIYNSVATMNTIYESKWTALHEKLISDVEAEFEREKQLLEVEFRESIRELEEEIRTSFDIISFRYEEERKAIALMEDIATNVAQSQGESQRQEMVDVLDTLSAEIVSIAEDIARDPWFAISWGQIVLGLVVVVVFVLEFSRSLHIIFNHWQNRTKQLYSQQQFLPSLWNTVFGNAPGKKSSSNTLSKTATVTVDGNIANGEQVVSLLEDEALLVFSSQENATRKGLVHIAKELFVAVDVHSHRNQHGYASFVHQASTPMPNLLFYGPAGCGKSETAKQLAHYICQDRRAGHFRNSGYIVFSGADLLALGDQASSYIRELFDRYGQNRQGTNDEEQSTTILIIDESDEIICTRDAHRRTMTPRSHSIRTTSRISSRRRDVPPEEETPEAIPFSSSMSIAAAGEEDQDQEEKEEASQQFSGRRLFDGPHNVLYALLDGLRLPSSSLSVIFTTRLPLSQIDPAFLDRMDNVLLFARPGPTEALQYILRHFLEVFGDFFSASLLQNRNNNRNNIVMDNPSVLDQWEILRRDAVAQENLMCDVTKGDISKILHRLLPPPSSSSSSLPSLGADEDNVADNLSVTSNASYSSTTMSLRPRRRTMTTYSSNTATVVNLDSRRNHHINDHSSAISNNKTRQQQQRLNFTSATQRYLYEALKEPTLAPMSSTSFCLETCIQLMILHACRLQLQPQQATKGFENNGILGTEFAMSPLTSVGWSYRDFHKRLMNIRFAAMCSEHCQISTKMWLDELLQSD